MNYTIDVICLTQCNSVIKALLYYLVIHDTIIKPTFSLIQSTSVFDSVVHVIYSRVC